jgi:hypothetical protein
MAAGGAAAAAAAIARAIAASGVVVRLDPEEFSKILLRIKDPLVVTASGGWLRKISIPSELQGPGVPHWV